MVDISSQPAFSSSTTPGAVAPSEEAADDRRQIDRLRAMRQALRPRLQRAMHDERVVVRLVYLGDGEVTVRFVSPIRFIGADRMLAYCLCREAPRQFHLDRCLEAVLMPAAEVTMPMPLTTYTLRDNDHSCC